MGTAAATTADYTKPHQHNPALRSPPSQRPTHLRLRSIHREKEHAQEPEELRRAGVEPDAPVAQHGEHERAEEEVRERRERVREDVRPGAVQPVHALAREDEALLEEGGDARDGHEPQERDGEEVHGQPVVLRAYVRRRDGALVVDGTYDFGGGLREVDPDGGEQHAHAHFVVGEPVRPSPGGYLRHLRYMPSLTP